MESASDDGASKALNSGKPVGLTADSIELLMQCFEPLLVFKRHQALAFTISEDLVREFKWSLSALQGHFEEGRKAEKGKRARSRERKDECDAEARAELDKLDAVVSNIELM